MNFNTEIKNIISTIDKEYLKEIDVYFCNENKKLWSEFCLEKNSIPLRYSLPWIEYQNTYLIDKEEFYADLSLIFKSRNKIISIWPISIIRNKQNYFLSSQNAELLPPLLRDNTNNEQESQIHNIAFIYIKLLVDNYSIKKIKFIEDIDDQSGITSWYKRFKGHNSKKKIKHYIFLNLNLNEKDIWKIIRKSYKNIINRASKKYRVLSLFSDDQEIWQKFKKLHFNESGKLTRSEETWTKQISNIKIKKAILFYILDKNSNMIGGAFFDLTNFEAFYSVAAYDKKMRKEPISHFIIYSSILKLKSLGLKKINFGEYDFNKNKNLRDEKEYNIQKFKKGFSSDIETKLIFENIIK